MGAKLCAALVLLFCGLARAGDFEDGYKAWFKGDYTSALQKLKPEATKGNAEAQLLFGDMYAEGQGVKQNYGKK